MATDWSGRAAALKYYERELQFAKRVNAENKELVEEAVNALRRSQDHTAIQTKLNDATKALRDIDKEIGSCRPHSNTSALELWTLLTVVRAIVQSQLGKNGS